MCVCVCVCVCKGILKNVIRGETVKTCPCPVARVKAEISSCIYRIICFKLSINYLWFS